MMKRGTMTKVFAAVIAAALCLSSCQEFFTSSLGAWAGRTASVPDNLTASQALSIADTALENCDTDLAAALLPQLAAMATTGTPSAEIVEAAVDTAVLATGVSEAITSSLATVAEEITNYDGGALSDTAISTLSAALASITVTTDSVAVYTLMTTMLPANLAAANVTASDCALAAASLLAAIVSQSGTLTLATLLDGTYNAATLQGAEVAATTNYYNLASNLLTVAGTLDSSDSMYSLVNSLIAP